VQLLLSAPARDHEPGVPEHPEVLHHAEPRHHRLRLQLGQRAAVTREQEVEQETKGGVGESR
jgi:hypothetical protein